MLIFAKEEYGCITGGRSRQIVYADHLSCLFFLAHEADILTARRKVYRLTGLRVLHKSQINLGMCSVLLKVESRVINDLVSGYPPLRVC